MKAVVIGAGCSGLVSAALLARRGVAVELYDQNDFVGGVLSAAHKNGYRWDQGPLLLENFLEGEPAFELLRELGITLQTVRGERGIWTPEYDMWRPDAYEGPYWRRERLKALFPAERRGIDAYYRFTKRVFRLSQLSKRLEKSPGAWLKLRLALAFLPLKKFAPMNAEQMLDHFFTDARVKMLFAGILADFCVAPREFHCFGVPLTNSEVAFDMRIPCTAQGGGVFPGYCYFAGGTERLAEALAKAVTDAGGHIHTGVEVEKILIEDGRVRGVRLADQTTVDADIVVASGGMREVFFDLVGREHLSESYIQSIERCRTMDGVFMVHLGVDFDPLQYQRAALCYYYGCYDLDAAVERMRAGVYHDGEDGFLIYVPSAHSAQAAPEGKHAVTIYTVCPDTLRDGTWEERRDAYARRLVELAERHLPGLSEHITEMQIMTPVELRKLTHLKKAAFGGVVPIMGVEKPDSVTPVEGLYFVGAQSRHGGGVSGSMLGARKVFDQIAARHGL